MIICIHKGETYRYKNFGGKAMLRTRDFYLKKVYDTNGKKIGTIEDIYIDFYNGRITGFEVSNYTLLSKKNYLDIDDVVYMGEYIVADSIRKGNGLKFKDIKSMDVVNRKKELMGVLDELIINIEDNSIKGLILSSGMIDTMINGKEIILISDCILGEKYILYTGNLKVSFKSMPHEMEVCNVVQKA